LGLGKRASWEHRKWDDFTVLLQRSIGFEVKDKVLEEKRSRLPCPYSLAKRV